jgi:hypothetical protein
MENQKHWTRMLTAFSVALLLAIAPLALAGSNETAADQEETKSKPIGLEIERIDEPDFACGERCSVDLCISDALTTAYHWCGLSAMGDSCDGGYDPYFCSGESGF